MAGTTTTYAEAFKPDMVACHEMLNAGSLLKVANLYRCASEPTVWQLANQGVSGAGDTTMGLAISGQTPAADPSDPPAQIYLSKGTMLYFNGGPTAVVAADTAVTTGNTTVPVNPLASGIGLGDTAPTWALQTLLSPTELPISDNDTTVDRTDLTYGLQASAVKTNKEKTSAVVIIARPDDRAFWDVIYPASQQSHNIYAHIVRNGGVRVYGPAKVMSLTQPGGIREISRPTFTLNFQAPYAAPPLRQYITDAAQQVAFDTVMHLSGVTAQ